MYCNVQTDGPDGNRTVPYRPVRHVRYEISSNVPYLYHLTCTVQVRYLCRRVGKGYATGIDEYRTVRQLYLRTVRDPIKCTVNVPLILYLCRKMLRKRRKKGPCHFEWVDSHSGTHSGRRRWMAMAHGAATIYTGARYHFHS